MYLFSTKTYLKQSFATSRICAAQCRCVVAHIIAHIAQQTLRVE